MKLVNLRNVYIYKPTYTEDDGSFRKSWTFKVKHLLNVQQDVNELDMTVAGTINYDILKLRSDKYFDIDKDDGVSLTELGEGEIPTHIVNAKNVIGRSVTYTCHSYIGE